MQIRSAITSDAHAIAEIHVLAWQAAYRDFVPSEYLVSLSIAKRERTWAATIAAGRPHVLVADSGSDLLGWVAFDRSRDIDAQESTGELWGIYVSPGSVGKGVGRELWLCARSELSSRGCRSATLWVLAQNERACQFYAKAGFSPEPESAKTIIRGGVSLVELRYACSLAI